MGRHQPASDRVGTAVRSGGQMDRSLRRALRDAGTPGSDRTKLLAQQLRAGQVHPHRVAMAAHFGLLEAQALCPGPLPRQPCSCTARRRGSCRRCYGKGGWEVPTDLIPAVAALQDEIGLPILRQWAADCVEHAALGLTRRPADMVVLRGRLATAMQPGAVATTLRLLVSFCYQLTGHKADERRWQALRLGELLAGI